MDLIEPIGREKSRLAFSQATLKELFRLLWKCWWRRRDGYRLLCSCSPLNLSEIAAACASTAVIMSVHNSICCGSIEKFGTEEQKKEFLLPMTEGKIIGAFALTEPEAGSDAQALECSAVKDGDHFIVNGTKCFITSGKNGGVVILLARTKESGSDAITAFLATPDMPGFKMDKVEEKRDSAHRYCSALSALLRLHLMKP